MYEGVIVDITRKCLFYLRIQSKKAASTVNPKRPKNPDQEQVLERLKSLPDD